jgi:outer membrane protein assembly factor BamA
MPNGRSPLGRFICFFPLFFLIPFFSFSQNVPPPCGKVIVDTILLNGNKLTKSAIIRRELSFREGDTITATQLNDELIRSKQNLLNTSLFNFVTFFLRNPRDLNADFAIDTSHVSDGYCHCVVRVDLRERWYLWPQPIIQIFEQNINTWAQHPTLDRLSYGLYLSRYNVFGKKQILTITLRMGYAEQYGVSYTIPYIDKKQRGGLTFSGYYTRTHEVPYASFDNKYLFYRDDHFRVREEINARAGYSYRLGIYTTLTFEVRYNRAQISDTLLRLTDNYLFGNRAVMEYLALNLSYILDHRDSKPFPLKGYYISSSLTKTGLGILSNEKVDLWQLGLNLRRYWQLSGRLYAGVAFKGRLYSNANVPFYLQNTLGYRDYVRGYEYYVMQGQSFSLLKNEVRYEIVKPHVKKIAFLPLEKFNTFHYALYAGVFADLGYLQNNDNPVMNMNTLCNALLFGYGAGVDLVTYYDVVLRVEYAFNRNGENGLFFHLNSPL